MKKGTGISGDVKGSFSKSGVTFDTTVSSDSKVSTALNFDVAKGMKCSVSASIPDKASGKLSLSMKQPYVAAKGSVGLNTAPKVEGSICTGISKGLIGADLGYDTAKSTMTKMNFGVGYAAEDFGISVFLMDKLDTVKVSYSHKILNTNSATVGAEVVRKLSKSETTFTIGALTKLEEGATAKAKIDNHGVCSMLYQLDIRPKTVATFSAQFDMKTLDKNAKVGMNLAIKP